MNFHRFHARIKPAPYVSGCSQNLRLRPIRTQSHAAIGLARKLDPMAYPSAGFIE
jgi:hypothetical protein